MSDMHLNAHTAPTTLGRRGLLTAASFATSIFAGGRALAAPSTVRVATQLGLAYLPLNVMEHDRLWERHADRHGLRVAVEYVRLGGGEALNDALISGSVELVAGGVAPMLLLWDRTLTTMNVRGYAALNASPMYVLTNNPRIRSISDFRAPDRIALPAVRISIQAIALMAAAERAFGPGQAGHLDDLTVAMQHPEALAALIAPGSQLAGYVSSSPFQEIALTRPEVRRIADSFTAFGGPTTFSVVYGKDAFAADNPELVAAFHDALREAVALILRDPDLAIDKYLAVTRDRTDRGLIKTILLREDFRFGTEPVGTMRVAELMHRTGILRRTPNGWTDYFASPSRDGQGS